MNTPYFADHTDCWDTSASIHPGVAEIADGYDNDCVGLTDEGMPTSSVWYRDYDSHSLRDKGLVSTTWDRDYDHKTGRLIVWKGMSRAQKRKARIAAGLILSSQQKAGLKRIVDRLCGVEEK